MIHQNTVTLSYITNEINHKYENVPQASKDTLIYTCDNFIKGQISFENARSVFLSIDPDISFLNKLQRILTIENEPLPPPEILGNFSQKHMNRSFSGGCRKKSSPWTELEDLRLVAAIFRFGAKDWRQIAEFVGNDRSSSQCNQRWCRAIDPNISHSPWSQEEDQQLLRAVEVLGNKNWCQVAKIIDRRTDLQCRYRYQQLIKTSAAQHANSVHPITQQKAQNSDPFQSPSFSPGKDPRMAQTAQPSSLTKTETTTMMTSISQIPCSFPLLGTGKEKSHAVDSDDALVAEFVPKNSTFVPPTLEEIASQRRSSITIAPFVVPPTDKRAPLPKHEPIPYYLDGSKMTPMNRLDLPLLHRVPPRIFIRNQTELA